MLICRATGPLTTLPGGAANSIIIRRGQPIYVKPAPSIDNVVADQTLNGSTSADVWVSGVREAESVWAKIIPPDINPETDGVPITDLDTIELQDTDYPVIAGLHFSYADEWSPQYQSRRL